ncbi:F-box/LRR-repeat protein [Pyrus ussuriensis x Pyrus communis]|uniref:F-box/LRR-repeat protein n=1 Tax=Pyrus ussuriensis x Pyrus communis TaxID=2448454 RepID=A0A5N5F0K0_9ROSA|nr:F-box/LRR-repeat protein [Pyrus ussuriensis x Pyrus communis]
MDDGGFPVRKWEDLDTDILVKIFQSFDIFGLTSGIAHVYCFDDTSESDDSSSAIGKVNCSAVCKKWRSTLCDPRLWNTLDLSTMKSHFIKTLDKPYVYVCSRSEMALSRALKISLSLSQRNITTLIFNLQLYVPNDLFIYTAERCPNLKRLVMPSWNKIEINGIRKAIGCWKDLESLTIGNIEWTEFLFLLKAISNNCKIFSELKLLGARNPTCNLALELVKYLPNLKVLSLRCSMFVKEALTTMLDGLQNLQVLNVSHCLVLAEIPQRGQDVVIVKELDRSVVHKASRLRRFITCMHMQDDDSSCVMCMRNRNDEGIVRWYRYEEGLWKEDEVKSLAV